MSISQNFPALKPSMVMDFANVKQLDPRVTYSRASTATYYDGRTTAKAEENLVLYSQSFNSASWTRADTTIDELSAIAPDGTTTANTATTSLGSSNLRTVSVAVQPSTTYTFSFFALRGTMTDLKYSIYNNTAASDIVAPTSYYASTNASTWSRVSVTFTTPAGCTSVFCFLLRDSVSTGTVFLWGAQLEQRSSVTAYTVTTAQPITNYIPVLQTALDNVARFDHNPVTGESLGLFVEEQRSNLLTYSDDFSNASWTKVNSSITANILVAPDGTLTGDLFIPNTGVTTATVDSATVLQAKNGTYTASVYMKFAGFVFASIRVSAFSGNVINAFINLTTGETAIRNDGAASGATASAQSVGNGWWRVSVSGIPKVGDATTGVSLVVSPASGLSSATFPAADGYSGIYIWGAQLEAGAFATSYIPTVASQVTRSADAASMTGANFSSWYNTAEGTLYAEASLPAFSSTATIAQATQAAISDGTGNNLIRVRGFSLNGTSSWDSVIRANGTTYFDSAETVYSTVNFVVKNAVGYKVNDAANSVNAGSAASGTPSILPVVDQMRIGSTVAGADISVQCIRRIAYYPRRLTNAQLQAITG